MCVVAASGGCGDADQPSADTQDAVGLDEGDEVAVSADVASDAADDTIAPEDAAAPDDSVDAEVIFVEDTTRPDDTTTPMDAAVPEDTSPPVDIAPTEDSIADVGYDWGSNDPYAGLDSAALRARLLGETTEGHTPLGYTGVRNAMYAVGGVDDVGGRIECIYTGRTVDATGSRTPSGSCARADGTPMNCSFNTEHTWAKYYLDLVLTENSAAYNAAEGDIHHLFPSDQAVNTARWHFDFGETDCLAEGNCKINEESRVGERPGVSGYANCPTGNVALGDVCLMRVRDARQGDVARGMLYMSVRYEMPLEDVMEAALRIWNQADPPDDRERTRNDGAEAAQGNRNPFVDRPDLVQRINDF